jgi:small-conductance mechanosensitive channel
MSMDLNSVLQPIGLWLADFSSRILPEYILPNIRIILQLVLILAIAYICARLGKALTAKLLHIVGLKRLTEKSWAEGVLRITGYKGSVVELISDLVKWLIYIMFFTLILQTVGLSAVADIMGQIAIFVPRFIGAILLIVVGFIIADFFGKVFGEAASKTMGIEALGSFIGGIVRYTIGMVVLIMSLALIGIDIAALAILLSAMLVMVIIITTFGIKDILPEITAGIQLKNIIKVGEKVKVSGYSGAVEGIDPVSTRIKTRNSTVLIPNSTLAKAVIEKPEKGVKMAGGS